MQVVTWQLSEGKRATAKADEVGQLLEQIAEPNNLRRAFSRVRSNKGAAGIDRKSIAAFEQDLERELAILARRLLSQERYQPPPVRAVEIDKPGGGSRPLGIPTVADRVVQQATLQVIGPMFEQVFKDCSYGFRPGRGAKTALTHLRRQIAQGDNWVAEFDIEGFFDNLSHARLLRWFAKVVDDAEVIGLVRRWLKAGVMKDGIVQSKATGTPQGGVISPLLANLYLHRLDEEATKAGLRFVRYADDFIVTANRRWKARRADTMIRELLADIGLSLNEDKSGVRNLGRDEAEFLGFTLYRRFLRPRSRAIASFKAQIRYLTRRNRGVSLQAVVDSLSPVIRGWGNYFVDGHIAHLFRKLDQWVRMRLRSYKRKAIAKPGLNWQMPTGVLQDMGLVSLVSLRQNRLFPAMG
ncbi:MAG: group II intron reverse transcriptase/maturase [Actinomycetota bacterium]